MDEEEGEDEMDEESKDLDLKNNQDDKASIELKRKRSMTKAKLAKQASVVSQRGILGHQTIVNEEGIEEESSNEGMRTRNTRARNRIRKAASGDISSKHAKSANKTPTQANINTENKSSVKKNTT